MKTGSLAQWALIALAFVLVSVGTAHAVTVSNPLAAGPIVLDGQNTGGEWDAVQPLTFKTFPGTVIDPLPTAPGDPSTDSFFRAVVGQDTSTNLFHLYTSIEYRSRTKLFVLDDVIGAMVFQFLNGGVLVDGGAFLFAGASGTELSVFEFPFVFDDITGLPIQAAHGFLTSGPGTGSLFIEMSHQLDVPSGFSGVIPAQTGVTPVTPTEWFSLLFADSEDPLATVSLITITPDGSTILSPDSLLLPVPEPAVPFELVAGVVALAVIWRRGWQRMEARCRP
jgi:hypothetical protein